MTDSDADDLVTLCPRAIVSMEWNGNVVNYRVPVRVSTFGEFRERAHAAFFMAGSVAEYSMTVFKANQTTYSIKEEEKHSWHSFDCPSAVYFKWRGRIVPVEILYKDNYGPSPACCHCVTM